MEPRPASISDEELESGSRSRLADMDKSLVELFRLAGAPDPEAWARSQEKEGIPQLARFLFLRQAWKGVTSEDDVDWIERSRERARKRPDEPYSGSGHALERLLAAGANPRDLTELVRCEQAGMIFHLCYLLDDPSFDEPEFQEMHWGLFQLDGEGNPI